MPAGESRVPEAARALVGLETRTMLGEVTLLAIQRYAAAAGDRNPLYFDEEYARRSAYGGIIAPPGYLAAVVGWEGGPPEEDLMTDGLPAHPLRSALSGLGRLMGAGQELEFLVPVRPGDRITCVSRIAEVVERAGQSGRFVLLTFEARYLNQRDEVAVVCRSHLIVR